MKRVALLLTAAVIGACSIQQAPPTDPTSLPVDDMTAESVRQTLAASTAPPLTVTVISVDTPTSFDDMEPATAEISVEGDRVATGPFPTSSAALIAFEPQPGADPAEFQPRRLTFTIDVRDSNSEDTGLLSVTIFVPENLTGAHNLEKATAIMVDQFGLVVSLADLDDDFLNLADPAGLALQGDIRVLTNDDTFTAAFDFTLTSGVTGQSVHLVGRANQIPYIEL
ncbi:MAG: hypothetical protein IPK19_35815 [Chloroflexi bacterium]|nr:hypothetical protein [Chloroflexota bacterium]